MNINNGQNQPILKHMNEPAMNVEARPGDAVFVEYSQYFAEREDELIMNVEIATEPSRVERPYGNPPQFIYVYYLAEKLAQLSDACNSNTWYEKAKKQVEMLTGQHNTIRKLDFVWTLTSIVQLVHFEKAIEVPWTEESMRLREFLNLTCAWVVFSLDKKLLAEELVMLKAEMDEIQIDSKEWEWCGEYGREPSRLL